MTTAPDASDAPPGGPPPGDAPADGAAARRDHLRAALVAAASRAIEEGGHGALRARALAAEAGCAVGAIYTAFADLDELVLAVKAGTLDRLEGAMAAAVDAVPDGEGAPAARLLALAGAYRAFAVAEPRRWRALFEHRLPEGRRVPDWYQARLDRLFVRVEAPLAALLPAVAAADRAPLGRALFSAVHGVVALGLEERLGRVAPALIGAMVEAVVRAALAGFRADPSLARIAPEP